ncbi:MAG: alpha-E domain-containing protein [Pseudomonadota bacterium]
MLARVAETFYWMTRYLERVENLACLINVNANFLFDMPKEATLGWEPLIDMTGSRKEYEEKYNDFTEKNIIKFLLTDSPSAISLLSALSAARENARTIREVIPCEAWERINTFYNFVSQKLQTELSKRDRAQFLKEVIHIQQSITGLLSGCMNHDQAYLFIRIGRNIERADMTSRFVDVKVSSLSADDSLPLTPFENIQWMSVLKSLNGYQMYRQSMQVRVRRSDVLKFLFKFEFFPRSVLFCVSELESSVQKLPIHEPVLRRIHSLKRIIQSKDVGRFNAVELHEYIDQIQVSCNSIHQALNEQYFLSGR